MTAIDKLLYAGNAQIPIDGFGSVTIKVQTPNGVRSLALLNVAHIPSFHTNVFSLRRFIDRGIYWDIQNERLTSQGNTFCPVIQHHGQWTLEYNEPKIPRLPYDLLNPGKTRKPRQRSGIEDSAIYNPPPFQSFQRP